MLNRPRVWLRPVNMVKFAALAMAVCLAGFAIADEYVVKNTRASKLLGAAVGVRPGPDREGGTTTVYRANGGSSLIPAGVTVEANDEASKLIIEGPKDRVKETIRLFQQFDVRPRNVHVILDVSCVADKYAARTSFDVPNNASHGTDDGVVGVKVTVSPRINGDGTITAYLGIGKDGNTVQAVARCKMGVEQTMSILGKQIAFNGALKGGTVQPESAERIVIRFSLSVADRR